MFSRNPTQRKCEGKIGEALEQEENLCDEVETVWEFTFHGYRVSEGGGNEAAVTARTRYVWVKSRECGELLNDRKMIWEFYKGQRDPC